MTPTGSGAGEKSSPIRLVEVLMPCGSAARHPLRGVREHTHLHSTCLLLAKKQQEL